MKADTPVEPKAPVDSNGAAIDEILHKFSIDIYKFRLNPNSESADLLEAKTALNHYYMELFMEIVDRQLSVEPATMTKQCLRELKISVKQRLGL